MELINDPNYCAKETYLEDFARPLTVSFDFACEKNIPARFFGDNMEHTRDCVNSGISAELLKNRKFAALPDHNGCALFWEPIGARTAFAFKQPYTRHGEGYRMVRSHECNSQTITSYNPGPAGIRQKGLYISKDKQYLFSMTAKVFSPLDITVQLVDKDGICLSQAGVKLDCREFATLEVVLSPEADCTDAALEILFSEPGTLTLGSVSLLPGDHFHGMRPDVIARLKELGIRLLRWPGGNFSGEYHWKDGLLPRDQRSPLQSYLWLETQPHTLGYDFHEINTDDFIALCRELGAMPFITINPTWNTPEESAQWVEYCNGDISTPYGSLRAQRGHPEPYNVTLWSLGNELGYGHMEGANGPAEYAAAVRRHAEKMLEVSPDLELCSCGPYPNRDWAEKSAFALKDVASLVSLHHYAEFPEFIDPETREKEYYYFIGKVNTEYLPLMDSLHRMLDPAVSVSLDEWNSWAAWYRNGSITEGIFAARLLNVLYRDAEKYGIRQVCHFESINEGSIRVLPDRAYLTPAGQAIAAMAHHAEGTLRALMDDVVATEKDGMLTATLINRSYREDKPFQLLYPGEITQAVLYSGEDVVPNSFFQESVPDVKRDAEGIRLVLPPHSIAVLKIRV